MNEHGSAGMPSGNGKYIAVVAVLLVGLGAILVWKFALDKPAAPTVASGTPSTIDSEALAKKRQKELEKETVATAEIPTEIPSSAAPDPPPSASASTKTVARSAWSGGPAPSGTVPAGDCNQCSGVVTPDLQAAVRTRANMARACYQKALERDSNLQGKVTATVRVSSTGRLCSAGAGPEIGGGVASCVAGIMRSGAYPAAGGSCADVSMTLNFVPNK
jgi:hypothetical protein